MRATFVSFFSFISLKEKKETNFLCASAKGNQHALPRCLVGFLTKAPSAAASGAAKVTSGVFNIGWC